MNGARTHIEFWWKIEDRDHQEDQDIGGRIVLNWILREME
jgi:hypothetical protein